METFRILETCPPPCSSARNEIIVQCAAKFQLISRSIPFVFRILLYSKGTIHSCLAIMVNLVFAVLRNEVISTFVCQTCDITSKNDAECKCRLSANKSIDEC